MKREYVLLGAVATACSLFSCRKDLDKIAPAPTAAAVEATTRPAQLAAGAWHQTGLLVSTTGANKEVVTADLFAHVSPGKLDQLATFGADGAYSVLKGQALQAKQGHWKLNAASDSLTLTLPDQVRHLAVTALTPTALSLSFTDKAANGTVSTYTATYAR